MRIAYIVHDYHRAGGHSRYVAELASRASQRHEVHVFANRIEGAGETKIHFHKVPAWRTNAFTTVLSFIIPATLQVGRGFDIIHSQGFCGLRGNVFTAHICNRAWHRGLQRMEGGASFRVTLFDAMSTTLEFMLYRFARNSQVIAISNRVARDLVTYYGCRLPITVIHHGVDLDVFTPGIRKLWRREMRAEYGLSGDEFAFLYVGDLRKGAARCIQALAQNEHARLLVVSRSRTGPYQALVKDVGLEPERVLFLGATDHVERAYAAADALLLPTPYDAFAMVVSEAMACGLPVIVSREAGASELIVHGRNGLLLNDVANVPELAGLMRSLTEDRALASQLGDAARSSVEVMSWDAVADQTMSVYRQLLDK